MDGSVIDPHGTLRRAALAAASGDERAWDSIVERFERAAWVWSYRPGLTAEDRSDVVWAAFTSLWRQLRRGSLTEPERIAGYLRRTVRNEANDVLARRTLVTGGSERVLRELLTAPEDIPGGAVDAPCSLEEGALGAFLRGALELLAPADREFLHAWIETSGEPEQYRRLASRLGRSPGSIGPTFGRCCLKLRKVLDELGFEPEEWLA